MKVARVLPLIALLPLAIASGSRGPVAPIAAPNDNRLPAGTLKNGILTLSLEARPARWYPHGDSLTGKALPAFAEEGKDPVAPGPLVRAPAGTEIRATILNSLPDTLVFTIPRTIGGAMTGLDSTIIGPGDQALVVIRARVPGNYFYRARHNDRVSRLLHVTGTLAGAIVVDAPGARPNDDRVFVLTVAADSATDSRIPVGTNVVMAINGRSWPHTERLTATIGDSVRWRVINASQDVHPMHLHGFYFRVDASSALSPAPTVQAEPGRMVVTERMPPFSTMTLTWTPEKIGNWLFHCHFQLHLLPPVPLDVAPDRPLAVRQQGAPHDHANHAMTGMSGLVMSVAVAPKPGDAQPAMDAAGRRQVRLVAIEDPGFPDTAPSMRFILEEGAERRDAGVGFSPPLDLVRGEPVAITVVNRLATSTSVHWHGMELDSYYDGVAGVSGVGTRLAPMIAPRDSFTALFTPPRAGTFIYHSHVDEPRTHRAGMLGAMIVRNAGDARDDDHTFFLKASLTGSVRAPIDVNGQPNPDTVFLRAGRPTRFRLIGLTLVNPNAVVMLTARADGTIATPPDALIQRWTPIAKDGADLPGRLRVERAATQTVSMGETYDMEVAPRRPGSLRLEVRAGTPAGALLARVPIVIR